MGWSSRDSNLRRNNIPARKTKPVTPETPLTPVAPHNQTTVGGGAVDLSVLDDRSMKTVATLHANVQQSFRDWIAECQILIKAMGYEYKAISGNRSWDEQAKLYAQGRTLPGKKVTNAGPGYSNHNFGIAVDMGVFKEGKYVDENKPAEAELVHLGILSDIPMALAQESRMQSPPSQQAATTSP